MTMRIYTRTGDGGETGLFGGQRVRKDHVRVEAYGDVDELNSLLGVCCAQLEGAGEAEMVARLRRIQADLFTVGANLATPAPQDGGRESDHIPRLPDGTIEEFERWIDEGDDEMEPLKNFILPGGTPGAASLHLARTVCRRAERRAVTLSHEAHVAPELVRYLNRLSDLLFTWARLANARAGGGDVPWVPNPR
jgi:cob(I)alamin adenosyltransferase